MSKKRGRPSLGDKAKSEVYRLRFTKDELAKLEAEAILKGCTVYQLMRERLTTKGDKP